MISAPFLLLVWTAPLSFAHAHHVAVPFQAVAIRRRFVGVITPKIIKFLEKIHLPEEETITLFFALMVCVTKGGLRHCVNIIYCVKGSVNDLSISIACIVRNIGKFQSRNVRAFE